MPFCTPVLSSTPKPHVPHIKIIKIISPLLTYLFSRLDIPYFHILLYFLNSYSYKNKKFNGYFSIVYLGW